MTLEKISGREAIKRHRDNPVKAWPSRTDANNRIEPIARPGLKPRFRLAPGSKVFTIGSCFARHVERALLARGFDIPALLILRDFPELAQAGDAVINNYTVGAIFNEVSWALDETNPFIPEQNFFELFPEKFIDVHLPRGVLPASLDVVSERRTRIGQIYRELVECPVIIITLGLAESWYDTLSGLYLNIRPHKLMLQADPDRFELHVLDYGETIDMLTKIFNLFDAHCRPDRRVLLTVSPVPLSSTYRDMDVATANSYSKAVLRAAADEIVAKFEFVDYYPSYESVVLSRRDLAWEEDQRHVRRALVDLNVERMIAAYVESGEGSSEDMVAPADEETLNQIRYGRPGNRRVVEFLDQRPGLLASDVELVAIYCDAALALGALDKAGTALERVPADWSPARGGLLRARWDLARGQAQRACERCQALLDDSAEIPKDVANRLWLVLLEATLAASGAEAGVKIIEAWHKNVGKLKKPEPFRLVAVALAEAGDDAAAEEMFKKALSCATGPNTASLTNFADFLTRRGREAEAEALFEGLV